MSQVNGNGRPASLPAKKRSWLVEGDNRERLIDMERRLRPVRKRTFIVIAAALVLSVPWVGWWTLAPLVGALLLFRFAEERTDRAAHPEYWMFGAWCGVELIIAGSLASTGAAAVSMLSLLAIPVVTLSARFSPRGIWLGVGIASALIVGVGFAADADAVLGNPPSLFVPLAVVIAVATLSSALMQSDVEHREKAILDSLTGLLNRTSLMQRVREIEAQSVYTSEPVGVVLLDLDEFKAVNDTYGHDAGDGVLADVGYRLRKGLRSYDHIYRPGGDEFLILVPGGDVDGALAVGRTARSIISQVAVGASPTRQLTVSVGVGASELGEAFVFKDVFERADTALYTAKRGTGLAIEDGGVAYRIEGSEG
jgi:diguanylate cyclase (GGDEF)-like protein